MLIVIQLSQKQTLYLPAHHCNSSPLDIDQWIVSIQHIFNNYINKLMCLYAFQC